MDPIATSTEDSLSAEIAEEYSEVSGYISNVYNHTASVIQHELESMSDHQKIGIALIFIISSLILITSLAFLCCGRRTCRRWFRREEKYIVYRRMVDFDPIIALTPSKTDIGKLPI